MADPSHRIEDSRVRLAAFAWLERQVAIYGEVLPRQILAGGFVLDGQRVPLVSRQGIFKPRVLRDVPLSIATTPGGPYKDTVGPDGRLRYSYRGTDVGHAENRGLRTAMLRRIPLIFFHGVKPGRYLASWPVYIVHDDPAALMFSVAIDAPEYAKESLVHGDADPLLFDDSGEGRRAYITTTVLQRLHQRVFRERVLDAYRQQCALCRLRHRELLDAAHIVPDTDPLGEPHVRNGLALCKLHHAAFDALFLAVRPDYIIQVRRDILEETDGPLLLHGLQELHGARLSLPRSPAAYPAPDLLELRYQRFREAPEAA